MYFRNGQPAALFRSLDGYLLRPFKLYVLFYRAIRKHRHDMVDTELGRAHVTKYLAVHDCGRIMNPLTARSQIKGGAIMGISMALHENLGYDRRSGTALSTGYYNARVATHRDAPEIDVIFIESDDGLGPFGAKSMGESSKVPAPAAVANAVANAIGVRMKDLPITRDKIVAALAAKGGRA